VLLNWSNHYTPALRTLEQEWTLAETNVDDAHPPSSKDDAKDTDDKAATVDQKSGDKDDAKVEKKQSRRVSSRKKATPKKKAKLPFKRLKSKRAEMPMPTQPSDVYLLSSFLLSYDHLI
jgi:hypothetical protein